ncbi:MAG: helicase-related protein, partial [Candidatus Pelagibacterales bacterium]
ATPGSWELDQTKGVFVEQIIRPTGLIDPEVEVRPAKTQIEDLILEARKIIENNHRVLVTTLTKRMAEDLTEYMHENGLKVRYMHSDIDTLERIEILQDLRRGVFDILIGINLLREGLDIPECALVAILDADKEGFLRSERSLVQTIGRAARNVDSKVILYGDKITKSMQYAINETKRRRLIQEKHNKINGITPQSIKRDINQTLENININEDNVTKTNEEYKMVGNNIEKHLKSLRDKMIKYAEDLNFEEAANIRDEIRKLEKRDLELDYIRTPKQKKNKYFT